MDKEIKYQKKVFISYSWADSEFVDKFDQEVGWIEFALETKIVRDTRGVDNFGDIKAYMKSIKNYDFVIVFFSENYLASENCMFEMAELVNNADFKEKLIPFLISTTGIFNREERTKYYEYWDGKIIDLKQKLFEYETEDMFADLRKLKNIRNNIDLFFSEIRYLKAVNAEDLFLEENLDKIRLVVKDLATKIGSDSERVDITLDFFNATFCGIKFKEYRLFLKKYSHHPLSIQLHQSEKEERKLKKFKKEKL